MKTAVALSTALVVAAALASATAAQLAHAPDGGTRTMLTSIVIPPLRNAPFSATVHTEWTRYLEDGSTLVIQNHRAIARDSQGRIFEERRRLAAAGSPNESRLTQTEIADPATHTIALCDPSQHVCQLRFYAAMVPAALPPAGVSPHGANNLTRQDLGAQMIGGIETVGTREVHTLNAAALGTDRPMTITKEFWYAARLGLNLLTTRVDPRSGREVFTVTDIAASEPDPGLFTLPKDARIVDVRRPSPQR